MKEIKTILIAASLLLLPLHCFAQGKPQTQSASATSYDLLKTKGPDEFVLVYGTLRETNSGIFVQNDPKLPHDTAYLKFLPLNEHFFLGPVIPGGSYRLVFIESSNIKPYVTLSGSFLDFKAPSKPGLFYYGAFAPSYSVLNESPQDHEYKQTTDSKTKELMALKSLTLYTKGTKWDPLVKARIDQLRKENIPEEQ